MDSVTIGQTFEVALAAERAMERVFRGCAIKFAAHAELAPFWDHYAQDEVMHAEYLERLRIRLPAEKLARPTDERTVANLRAVSAFSVEKALAGVHNLEDAYQLIHELESGETNAIFEFLLINFETDKRMAAFLRTQLNQHVNHLQSDLPVQYQDATARQMVQATD